MKIYCFHNPGEENGILSNWHLSDFTVAGIKYSSLEQYMMHRKALCFGDSAIAAEILMTSDVSKIKALGRRVANYNDHVWNGMRQIIVYEGLLAKFSQNEECKKALLATGDALLVECAVKDRIWAVGLSMTDPKRLDPAQWQGQNLLGYALMLVRDKLRQSI